MTGGSIWVGQLELEGAGSVTGMNSAGPAEQDTARVLIRMHGAPLGFVSVPAQPTRTLTVRARAAAKTMLADAVRRHIDADHCDGGPASPAGWAALVACPRRFAVHDRPGISITVCTRDRTSQLRQSLGALRQVSYDPVEILIVDNAPRSDATRQLVTELAAADPRIRYVREDRPGHSRARNRGVTEARFGIVAFTDDDTVVDPGWPTAIAAGFAADPETVCVTGPVPSLALDTVSQRYFDARIPWAAAFDPRRYDLAANRDPSPLYPFAAGVFGAGANFAVRADAVTRIGGFDTALGAGSPCRCGDDIDIFLRLVLAGRRLCYVPSALVWHEHRAASRELAAQMYSYGYGLGGFIAKHLPERDFRAALARYGLGHAATLLGRMRKASDASHIGPAGKRLALTETLGLVLGAARYWPARRQVARYTPGSQ